MHWQAPQTLPCKSDWNEPSVSNSEGSQTDGYPNDWQIQDPFLIFAFCIMPSNQFQDEINSIQDKTGAVQCLKVHMQEKIQGSACSFGGNVFMYTPKWHQGEGREAGEVCKSDSEINGI